MTSKTVGGVTTTYTYDANGQLLSESRSGYSASYTYDANGNRASRTVNGVTETYTVDSGDKLTQVSVSGVATKTFGYDGAGRTTSIQTSSGTTSFTYDFESRVTGITYPNASTNSFTYNGLDTRVGKTDSAGTATFRRMGAGVTAPVLGDGSASFTPGISERRGSTSSFYGADYLGTNSSLYSAGETVSATRQYDAFGNQTSSSGSSANPFGFAGNWGYQNDSDSGLKLLGHRYYDASTGRFLTRDPIKYGRNWYAYCANDPVQYTDPTGLILPILVWVGVGIVAGAIIGAVTNPHDPLVGAGQGAVIGGISAGAGILIGLGVAAIAGAMALEGALVSVGVGAIAGGGASLASQGAACAFGWQDDIDWYSVGFGSAVGGIGGALVVRVVPKAGDVTVTHWGGPSPWVQAGGPTPLNRLLAGNPPGEATTIVVPGSSLTSPGGWEFGKGLLGQRILQ